MASSIPARAPEPTIDSRFRHRVGHIGCLPSTSPGPWRVARKNGGHPELARPPVHAQVAGPRPPRPLPLVIPRATIDERRNSALATWLRTSEPHPLAPSSLHHCHPLIVVSVACRSRQCKPAFRKATSARLSSGEEQQGTQVPTHIISGALVAPRIELLACSDRRMMASLVREARRSGCLCYPDS